MRAVHPSASRSGATSSAHHPGQLGEDGAELAVLGQGHRNPGVAGGGQIGVQRDGTDQRHPKAPGQPLAAARAEEGVGGAVLAGEVAHVLDHAGHPQVAAPGHVRRSGGDLLGRHRRRGHDQEFGARQQPGQAHLDVAGARGQVDQQVVEVAPVGVLEELLHGPVEHEAPPHDRLLLVGEEPHGQDPQRARADPALERDHLPGPGLDVTLHAQETGHGETPDVGIEHADHVTACGQRDGQVHRDRGLADAALARGDGQHPGAGRHRRLRSILLGLPAGTGHDGGPLVCVHGGDPHLDGGHPVERPGVADDVTLDLRAQRAGGDGQGHVDRDPSPVLVDGAHHAQVDDGVAQLGVDHLAQALAHFLLAGEPTGGRGAGFWSPSVEVIAAIYLRGHNFRVAGTLVSPGRAPR